MIRRVVLPLTLLSVFATAAACSSSEDPSAPADAGAAGPGSGDAGAQGTDGSTGVDTPDADAGSPSDAGVDADEDADADAGPALGACGAGKFETGEYGTYGGKVNVHRDPGGTWAVDDDCSSGANNNTVAYCQKFWPYATSQVSVPVVGNKPFTAGGGTAPTCGGVYDEPGQAQYTCCAANPCADGFVPVGTYATWSGKVNMHRGPNEAWEVDSDCVSGANNNTVAYCQKFWAKTTTQVAVTVEPGDKPFTAGGGTAPACGGVFPGPGQNQYVCCAPR